MIFKLTILSSLFYSFNTFATVSDLTAISLKSGEVITPARDIEFLKNNSIQLFDGRTINNSEIRNIEVNDSFGNSKVISVGNFKIISVDAAKITGGDATGGG